MKNLIILIFAIFICCISCRQDSHSILEGPSDNGVIITEESDLTGIITDQEGNPVGNAKLTIGNIEKITDENGFFYLKNIEISSKGTLVKATKDGFIPQYRFAFNEPGKLSFLNFTMIPETIITTFYSANGGTFTVQDKSKVSFKPNSILDKNGSIYTGEVTLKGYWFDPFDERITTTMPGDLRGVDSEGKKVQLATLGMFSLDIYDTQGNELFLGESAELSFYVGNNGVDLDGTGIVPLWSFNENTGEWIEEHTSTLKGDYYVGEVSHFSFWNCDIAFPVTSINGILVDEANSPIPNTVVTITQPNTLQCGIGITNEEGYFEANVPAGVSLSLTTQHCEDSFPIGPFSGDTNDLGYVSIGVQTKTFTGKLMDCNEQPVSSGYIIAKYEGTSKAFFPDENGSFSGNLVNCTGIEWKITAYDFDNLVFSDEMVIEASEIFTDLGNISFCNNIDTYFALKFDNNYTQLIEPSADELQVLLLNNECLVITNRFNDWEDPGLYYTIIYPLVESLPISTITQTSFTNSWVNYKITPDLSINFTEFGMELGDFISGNMEIDNHILNFRLKINQKEEAASIVLKTWNDENRDGIQDINEEPERGVELFLGEISQGETNFFDAFFIYPLREILFSNRDGFLQLVGLKPNREYTLFYLENDPELEDYVSPHNVGTDDNIDSDFIPIPFEIDKYQTDSFYLAPGEILTSYDLGIYH